MRAWVKGYIQAVQAAAVLSEQQVAFFRAFGYLRFPGLFAAEIEAISAAFAEIFDASDSPRVDMTGIRIHGYQPRTMIPGFVDRHPSLARLRDDPRILGIVIPLVGDDAEYKESDGNVFSCDTEWHCDTYGATMAEQHVKISFYLDRVRADSGAPRVIPGTNHWESDYARTLRSGFRNNVGDVGNVYGVEAGEIPAVVLDSDPGDVLLWDYRTIHASYGGGPRRRLFTMNFGRPGSVDESG